jgi:ankyrin repeat protein
MEAAGLAIGVIGLVGIFGACMDVVDRIDAYKDFGVEFRGAIARFEADKIRLQKWAAEVGIQDVKPLDPRLKDPEIELGVKTLLISALEIFEAAELTHSKMRGKAGEYHDPFSSISGSSIAKAKLKRVPTDSKRDRKDLNCLLGDLIANLCLEGVGWALNRKGKLTESVENFNKIIDAIYGLVPVEHDSQASVNIQKKLHLLVEDMRRKTRLDSEKAVNDWLGVTHFENQHDIGQLYDKQVSSRLEGTCQWIFAKPAYCDWISDNFSNGSKVLWICASAGSGKTILCASLVAHLKRLNTFPVAYFFASPHAQSGGDLGFIIRSWISQIARLNDDVRELLLGYSETGERAQESVIWELFGSIVSQDHQYTLFLDGFDEYDRLDGVRTRFLHDLKERIKETATRVLISSRDEWDIKTELDQPKMQVPGLLMLQCKISVEDVRHDISLFSKSVVDRKLPTKKDDLKEDLAHQLEKKSDGMFLWIKLQSDQIRDGKSAKQLQNIVKNMPIGLNKTYERSWKLIQDLVFEDRARALAILRWTAFALRPLTVAEITEALVFELGSDDDGVDLEDLDDHVENITEQYANTEIVHICASLVEFRKKTPADEAGLWTLHLVHTSVREFLISTLPPKPSSELLQVSIPNDHHSWIATICLAYLSCDDIWLKEDTGHKYAFVHYAAKHWESHTLKASSIDTELQKGIVEFLRPGNVNYHRWARYTTEFAGKEHDGGSMSALYVAAFLNFTPAMKTIWATDQTQLNGVGGLMGTPLTAACFQGSELAFDLLVSWGADPNIRAGKYGVAITAALYGGHKKMVKTLLEKRVDLNIPAPTGETPLFVAASQGDPEIVRLLIEAGAALNGTDQLTPLRIASSKGHVEVLKVFLDKKASTEITDNGYTPLCLATSNGHHKIVELLLEKGANPNAPNKNGGRPLHHASGLGQFDIVRALVERGAHLDVQDSDGDTPIHLASVSNHHDTVQFLLERGANPNLSDEDGYTPLHSVASRGSIELCKMFVERGAHLDVQDSDGDTPIHLASALNHHETVQYLLERGANPNLSDEDGRTPLHAAASQGYTELCKMLVERGAYLDVQDSDGDTPIYSASVLDHHETARFLLEKGANPNLSNKDGRTSLHNVAGEGHIELVRLLVHWGANIEATESDGERPLFSAIFSNHAEVAKLLLDYGGSPDASMDDGQCLLHAAASSNLYEITELLLEKGVNINILDYDGWTPLFYASLSGHLDIVKLLLNRGADESICDTNRANALDQALTNRHLNTTRYLLEVSLAKELPFSALGGYFGTIANHLAFKGFTDLLRLVYGKFYANRNDGDLNGRTALHLAAVGGHIDTLEYLLGIGLNPRAKDAGGNDLLSYASLGGSIDAAKAVRLSGVVPISQGDHWSPLHWACKAGKLDVVEYLMSQGIQSSIITISQPQGSWSPASIAIYHGHEKMLENLSPMLKFQLYLSLDSEIEDSLRQVGTIQEGFNCNACDQVSMCRSNKMKYTHTK